MVFDILHEDEGWLPIAKVEYAMVADAQSRMRDGFDEHQAYWERSAWADRPVGWLGLGHNGAVYSRLLEDRFRDRGVWHDDWIELGFDEWGIDADSAFFYAGANYRAALVKVVRALHGAGELRHLFGKDIPVLLSDLEEPDGAREATVEANPASVMFGLEEYM